MPATKLTAFALNCSLKPSDGDPGSSTDKAARRGLRRPEEARCRRPDTARRSQREARGAGRTKATATTGRSAQEDPRGRHPRPRHADLDGPALQRRQAGARADGRLPRRDQRGRPHAVVRHRRGAGRRRQRGRRAHVARRAPTRAHRRRVHHPPHRRPTGSARRWATDYVDLARARPR